ncbi:tripartite tricarboxylate transporter TctB family protein [Desulfospira joergensenii]|uniref:tripartite tricarboxylate transporter TctB family protein n=1 Tax=Desulfospira joergensenii TaxID=53329 RepID=UPI0013783A25|nr:tripartite tricarboxylate transporter TctB family protein [Desulfospira joergensenii]
MSRLRNDVISGLILLVFALALHLFIIPAQVDSMNEGPIALSPSLFCHITAFLLLLLSVGLVVSGLKDKKARTARDMSQIAYTVGRGATAILFSVLYIMAMEILGYFTSTILFMGLFLWFSGVRSWKGGVLFLSAIIPFIYLLFVKALNVILPSGLII